MQVYIWTPFVCEYCTRSRASTVTTTMITSAPRTRKCSSPLLHQELSASATLLVGLAVPPMNRGTNTEE